MLRGGHHGQIRRIHDNAGLAGKGGSLKGQGHGLKDALFILRAVYGIPVSYTHLDVYKRQDIHRQLLA